MSQNKNTKLELTWIGKEKRPRIEPRVLVEDPEKSHHAAVRHGEGDLFDNMLIHGDNLLALKALESDFAGQIKCVYIDPPYNTQSAFEHYDDNLEHSIWLGLMRYRLEMIKTLLKPDGVLFISIDDDECHYLKVLCDEVFRRENFCGSFIWEKKKKPSFLSNMGVVTEYILAYAKDKKLSPPFIWGTTTEGKKYPINNAGNPLARLSFPAGSVRFGMADQTVDAQDMSGGNIVTKLLNEVRIVNGLNENSFTLEGEWRYSQEKVNSILAAGEQIVISKIPFRPNHVKKGGEPKKMKNLLSVAHYNMATNEDATAESESIFGVGNAFENPKPELLISTLIGAVTNPGDLVLDSFLGSGTTAAVAHKMKRRWIGIELGEHCYTHCIPRLKLVVDGKDNCGVTKSQNWTGGGGFRFYEIAPSLIQRDDYGQPVINPAYKPEMLVEAICKLEGFAYAPSETEYFIHGRSTERDFIYVTTGFLKAEHLRALGERVGPDRTLLVCCTGFEPGIKVPNLTVKKIPQAVLDKCEFAHDDYSLDVKNLPMAAKDPVQGVLFD